MSEASDRIIDGVDPSIQDEFDRTWSVIDTIRSHIESLEQRMVFRVAPVGDVKFTHDCHGRKLQEPDAYKICWQCGACRWGFTGKYMKVCPACGTEQWWTGSVSPDARLWDLKLAPVPDYALASEDAGDFAEPTMPGVERCSCDEATFLRALIKQAREHVPASMGEWHEQVAEVSGASLAGSRRCR
jgi:hypothetical protein